MQTLKKLDITAELIKKRTVLFHTEVSTWSIEHLMSILMYLNNKNTKPITINLSSPGGLVDAGIGLYDFIKATKTPIHIHCAGLAASMGAILLASGTKGYRTASKNSRIMIHQPSGGFIGKATDIENHAQETARIRKLLAQLLANDTKQPLAKVLKDIEKDLWMTADEAKKYGLIDKVV